MKNKLRGIVEELRGRLTNDPAMRAKGKARRTVGEVEQAGKAAAYDAEHKDPVASRTPPTSPPSE